MTALPELTEIRVERLKARVPLHALSLESGIAAATLSLAERNELKLSTTDERKRREALRRLARKQTEK